MKIKPISRIFFALLLLSASVLFCEPAISIKINYYHLYSTTQSGLRSEMNEKGIRWTDGMTYDAFTSWYVKWRYEYYTNDGYCSLTNIDVSVDVEYTLPKWSVKFLGGKELRIKWIRYSDALKKHEDGHRDFGIGAGRKIETALLSIGSRPRCDTLGADANAVAYRILNDYRKKEVEYDRRTGHGRTQGAVFP
jgi:predicted secreted Zn-dependent protease